MRKIYFVCLIAALGALLFGASHTRAAFGIPDVSKLIQSIEEASQQQVCEPNTRRVNQCDNRFWGFATCNAQGTDWELEQDCRYLSMQEAQNALNQQTAPQQICKPNTRRINQCDNRLWGYGTCNAQGTDWHLEEDCRYFSMQEALNALNQPAPAPEPENQTPNIDFDALRAVLNALNQQQGRNVCTPNAKRSCTCDNRLPGQQVCKADGTAWKSCGSCGLIGIPGGISAPQGIDAERAPTNPTVFERVNGSDVPLERTANGNYSLRFGEVVRDTTKTIIIKNGNSPLAISGYGLTNQSSRSFSFAGSSDCLGTLAAGKTCSMAVKFTPDAAQWRTEVFGEIYVDSGERRVISIAAKAIHGAAPSIIAETLVIDALIPYRVLPKNADGTPVLDWGSTIAPATKSIVLRNAGTVNLSIPRMYLEANQGRAFDVARSPGCVGSLAPGHRCTVQIRFTPPPEHGLTVSRLIFGTNVPTLPGAGHEFIVELHGTSLLGVIQQPDFDPALLQGILGFFGNQGPIASQPAAEAAGGEQVPVAPAGQGEQPGSAETPVEVQEAGEAALPQNNDQLMAQVIQDLLGQIGGQGVQGQAGAGVQADANGDVVLAGVIEDLLAAFGQQQINNQAVDDGAQNEANVVSPLEHVNIDRVEQLADAYARAAAAPGADEDTKNTAARLQKLADTLRGEQQQAKEDQSVLPSSTRGYTILLIGSIVLLLAIIAGFVMWVMKM